MGRFLSVAALILLCIGTVHAQTDTTLKEEEENGPRRRPNGEWLLGITYATMSVTVPYERWDGYEWVKVGDTTIADTRFYGSIGYGGHIPLFNLGKYSTVWLVPAAYAAISASGFSSSSTDPEFHFDLTIPIHVTAGYGGLRRKANAWGIEGGIGLTASRRFAEGVFTIAPSGIIDVTYAPKNVYRLRFMTDLISYDVTPKESNPYTMHTWSLMFVLGL